MNGYLPHSLVVSWVSFRRVFVVAKERSWLLIGWVIIVVRFNLWVLLSFRDSIPGISLQLSFVFQSKRQSF